MEDKVEGKNKLISKKNWRLLIPGGLIIGDLVWLCNIKFLGGALPYLIALTLLLVFIYWFWGWRYPRKTTENPIEKVRYETKRYNVYASLGILVYEILWGILLIRLWGKSFKFLEFLKIEELIGFGDYDRFAITIIIFWMMIIIPYLAWVIYFYNINWGMSNEDWTRVKMDWDKHHDNFHKAHLESPLYPIDIPRSNPHKNETMGIPKGTIRGILALTVSIGGFAMMVSAMGKDSTLASNSFFIDNLEFFKTAFLMVMAFYFGTKGLEILSKVNDSSGTSTGTSSTKNDEISKKTEENKITPKAPESPISWSNEEFSDVEAVG